MRSNRRVVGKAALALVCFLLAGYAVQCGRNTMERVNSHDIASRPIANLRIGMQRSETLQYITEAWRHYDCESPYAATDVYVFGSRNLELAGTLYLRFDRDGDREDLAQIASVEYYMLNLFNDCRITEK